METRRKLKGTGNRFKDNPTCPCGKSNKDGKFVSFVGSEGRGKGFCHSCAKTFRDDSDSIVEPAAFKKVEIPTYCDEERRDLLDNFDQRLDSTFAKFLELLIGRNNAIGIVERYYLGIYEGSKVIFWQLDEDLNLRAGKVMDYSDNGKRSGYINWWRSIHNKSCQMNLCFFGQHLISEVRKPLAIVESEKTACLMSYFNPAFTWLASGGKSLLNHSKCRSISKYDVTLFPDHDSYDEWKILADEWDFKISKDCELWYDKGLINKGEDIADYYINLSTCLDAYYLEVDYNWNQEEYDSIFNKPKDFRSDIYTGRSPI